MPRASTRRVLPLWPILVIGALGAAPVSSDLHVTKQGAQFFEKQIRPLLVRNCYECHSGDPKKAKGGFVLDTREGLRKGGQSGPAIVPGHPDHSPLIDAVRYESLQMPPKGKLPDDAIDKLVRWVQMGAPDPRSAKALRTAGKIDFAEARKFWAFQRPNAIPPPKPHDSGWAWTNIDRFIRARQEAERLHPVANADRVTLIRRVTFDLIGLPPTLDEIDAFVSDKSPNAYQLLVDRLLASERFGECWGRHWLDVVRYGESTGKEVNLPYRYAWRYRNWVIDAFDADKPYDRFILEQLAGDLLPRENSAQNDKMLIATGFLTLGPKSIAESEDPYRYDEIDDQIDVTTRAFLGMTVACARCHDHKYDPIPTTDYYALAGIFKSTRTLSGLRPSQYFVDDIDLLQLSDSGKPPAPEDAARRKEIAQVETQLKQLYAQLRPPPVKAPPRKGKAPPQKPAAEPRVDVKRVRDQITTLEARRKKLETVPFLAHDLLMGVREGVVANSPVLKGGSLATKGPVVPRGGLTVLKTAAFRIDPRQSGRLTLARFIASKDNPLTARVVVNRVWQHLFGQGLVTTVDNFGALGEEPSHPALLDALALQFMNGDRWSIKKLIRSIVLSRTYRLSSAHDAQNYATDPTNGFLWRMEPRRLEAEEIRDAMLSASGELDLERPHGSPMLEFDNADIRGGKALNDILRPSNHRSVYLPILRGLVPEMLQTFDAPDPNLVVGERDVTTVAPQALFMMNNPFVIAQSDQMAARVLGETGPNTDARIDFAYRLAFGRTAAAQEKPAIRHFLADYRSSLATSGHKATADSVAWAGLCQALFASGEFRYRY
jgi:uncharacterized protein DUF1553/uncharacterized protein DUF1549/cytochrome c